LALVAGLYMQWRTPLPAPDDISRWVPAPDRAVREQLVTVIGRVESTASLTRNHQAQVWLQATQAAEIVSAEPPPVSTIPGQPASPEVLTEPVSGRLYVTVPLLQATGLVPGQFVSITGRLYRPSAAQNPGGFDFRTYLARAGCFAGMTGQQLEFLSRDGDDRLVRPGGLWQIRQRIVQSQVRGLGVPAGSLMAGMTLGRRAVDLPFAVQDRFIQVGLAHVLAASGFHVAVLLGLAQASLRRTKPRVQAIAGGLLLVSYGVITGGSPSVLRAIVMGTAVLGGMVGGRRVKPLGALLLAAVGLLVWNPLWIYDVGFQLSFVATLALLVTVPALTRRLDWLPPALTVAIAVPLAATLWTLPLQLFTFYGLSPYSLAANVVTGPLVTVVTAGGFVSGLAALALPWLGEVIASAFYYPVQGLLAIVTWFDGLPYRTVAVGSLSVGQVVAVYGLIALVWWVPWWQRRQRWVLALIAAIALVAVPGWQVRLEQARATVLDTRGDPALVVQEGAAIATFYGGSPATVRYGVLPFLKQEGRNRVDWAIALDAQPQTRRALALLLENLPVGILYDAPDPNAPPQTEAAASGASPGPATLADGGDRALAAAVQVRQGAYATLPVGETVTLDPQLRVTRLLPQATAVLVQWGDRRWLILGNLDTPTQAALRQAWTTRFAELPTPHPATSPAAAPAPPASTPPASAPTTPTTEIPAAETPTAEDKPAGEWAIELLWWPGQPLDPELIDRLRPQVAIAAAPRVDPATATQLSNHQTRIYWTGRDGALQWTPETGFVPLLEGNLDARLDR
jgi:competence protein ComEC